MKYTFYLFVLKSFRFGPGKYSRRHHKTERLRELRNLRSVGIVRDGPNGARPSRGSASGARQTATELTGDNTDDMISRRNKRPREFPVEVHRVVRQVHPPPKQRSFASAPAFQPRGHVPDTCPMEVSSNQIERPIHEERGHTELARRKFSGRDDSRPTSESTQRIFPKSVLVGRSPDDATTLGQRDSRHRLDGGPGVDSDTMARYGGGGGAFTVAGLSPQILPVRCSPGSRRPRTDGGGPRSSSCRSGGSVHNLRSDEIRPQEEGLHSRQRTTPSHQQSRASIGRGTTIPSCPTFSGVESNDVEVPGCFLTESDKRGAEELPDGFALGSKLEYPRIADTCGGIVLRLTPAERSLEPWGSTLAPLRAMCDIEPSLSRAGIEYRGVIHAVDGAQELKSHHKAKVRAG